MDQASHNTIVSFIWGIADDVLRDLFKRGKYPDVILPMCVLRRLDAILEPTQKAVLETKEMLDSSGITGQSAALCQAAGQAFYNTSQFTLRDLKSSNRLQQLRQDFEAYLDGFSPNVQEILDNFKFRNQISTLSKAEALGTLIEKFLDKAIAKPLYGLYDDRIGGKSWVVEYEPDTDLRDTEQVPPYTPDAWIDESNTKIGYEISFTRHFYKPQPLRTLDKIRADLLAVEREAEGVLDELLKGATA